MRYIGMFLLVSWAGLLSCGGNENEAFAPGTEAYRSEVCRLYSDIITSGVKARMTSDSSTSVRIIENVPTNDIDFEALKKKHARTFRHIRINNRNLNLRLLMREGERRVQSPERARNLEDLRLRNTSYNPSHAELVQNMPLSQDDIIHPKFCDFKFPHTFMPYIEGEKLRALIRKRNESNEAWLEIATRDLPARGQYTEEEIKVKFDAFSRTFKSQLDEPYFGASQMQIAVIDKSGTFAMITDKAANIRTYRKKMEFGNPSAITGFDTSTPRLFRHRSLHTLHDRHPRNPVDSDCPYALSGRLSGGAGRVCYWRVA